MFASTYPLIRPVTTTNLSETSLEIKLEWGLLVYLHHDVRVNLFAALHLRLRLPRNTLDRHKSAMS